MNSNLICLILALCLTSSFATRYTFSNAQGGSWQTAANWSPAGVPGSQDDAVFDYIDNMPNEVTITIDGYVTVNSFTVTHYSYFFRSGSLTVQNDCLLNAGTYTKINITLNGDSKFESTGSGNYVTCDSCVVNIKKSLQMLTITSGYAYIQNSAMFVNFAGATFTIAYGSIGSSLVQAGTIINYGTLIFRTYLMTYPKTPFGDPPVAETGPWSELQNYGDIQIEVNNSTIGVPVYNDIKTWNFNSGKITLRMVQDSTANTERRVFDPNYEYNDAISSGGAHNYYEANINGDVHIIFDQAQVVAGEADRPFNPKAGDFFPVFANFQKYSGRFNSISAEGLPSGLSLGRKNFFDDSTSLYHYGVIICKSDDAVCVNAYSSANVLEMGLAVLFALVAVLF